MVDNITGQELCEGSNGGGCNGGIRSKILLKTNVNAEKICSCSRRKLKLFNR